MSTFKEQMKNDFIPRLEKMLGKEIAHSEQLYRMRGESTKDIVDRMIEHSTNFINHLKQRIHEYKEYIK